MHSKARKYLFMESAASGVVNGILNYASGAAIFHGRSVIQISGHGGAVQDTIGETFLVTSLSVLVPTLIARHRRRAGVLPDAGGTPVPGGNYYVRALVIGLAFTCVCVPINDVVLQHVVPGGLRLSDALVFKTLYGALLGSIATFIALHKALYEFD